MLINGILARKAPSKMSRSEPGCSVYRSRSQGHDSSLKVSIFFELVFLTKKGAVPVSTHATCATPYRACRTQRAHRACV